MDYGFAKTMVDVLGWDGFLERLNIFFPGKDLFEVSQDWYKDMKYVLKARGSQGDLILYWS
ncbi:hypothetical protein [Paenibacillus kribbensis]|uniref:hypothetical protein n=1 Tax=Paenibacillus kribbensis TaxID=172713 RepID=UPI00114CE1ED|nr:hypothetical protein [Paenibacillus kribbensis]